MTDDTSLALCLADSIIQNQTYDPTHAIHTYCRWFISGYLSSKEQSFGYGQAIESSLTRWLTKQRKAKVYDIWTMDTDDPCACGDWNSWGAGSLTRVGPLAMKYVQDPKQLLSAAILDSKITHQNEIAIQTCCFLACLIQAALQGTDKKSFLTNQFLPTCPDFLDPKAVETKYRQNTNTIDLEPLIRGDYKTLSVEKLKTEYTTFKATDILTCALWAFYHTDNFESGLIELVNLGGDTDTAGAVYGQLAGAYYGEEEIPDWKKEIDFHQKIMEMSDQLETLSYQKEA